MFLAIETATDICSVVFKNKNDQIFEKRSETKRSHSENLFLFIDELMKEHSFSISDLDAVLVSEGPGSYTGLRIAASGVKGLLFEQEVSVFGINTLASLAMSAAENNQKSINLSASQRIHSIIDARRKHLYHQKFTFNERLKAETEVQITPIKQFEEGVAEDDGIIGTGLNRIAESIKNKAIVFGKGQITAKSLTNIYQDNLYDFINEVKPEQFEPKYYTSSQVG